ncbi:MAG: division/cell wall cluster transcriptional repressor MraZ [Candidatus Sumerlaeia bacterium]
MTAMLGFIGQHELKIDDKGRLSIPSKFKSVLQGKYSDDDMQVVISLGLDNCLMVEPLSVYEDSVAKLLQMNDLSKSVRRLKKLRTTYASQEKMDGSGRIRIPQNLRETVGISKEVICNGNFSSFEIWDKQEYMEEEEEIIPNREGLYDKLKED